MSLLLWIPLVLALLLPDAMLPVHMLEPSSSVVIMSSCQLFSSAPSVIEFQLIVFFIMFYYISPFHFDSCSQHWELSFWSFSCVGHVCKGIYLMSNTCFRAACLNYLSTLNGQPWWNATTFDWSLVQFASALLSPHQYMFVQAKHQFWLPMFHCFPLLYNNNLLRSRLQLLSPSSI